MRGGYLFSPFTLGTMQCSAVQHKLPITRKVTTDVGRQGRVAFQAQTLGRACPRFVPTEGDCGEWVRGVAQSVMVCVSIKYVGKGSHGKSYHGGTEFDFKVPCNRGNM